MIKSCWRIALFGFGFVGGLLPAASAFAWNETGHKVVDMIIWDELTPAAKAKATEILKHHPRYEKDLMPGLAEGADEAAAARHAFAVAGTWPDIVRSQSNPMHFVGNHPAWHYIDIPFTPEGQAAPATRPATQPATAPTSQTAGPANAIEAFNLSLAELKDPATSPAERAIALCWVLHLGGDIHQPLHACTLYSSQFPEGDKGGNSLTVLRDGSGYNSQTNLHAFWDSLLGNFKSEEIDRAIATGLRADPQFARAQLKSDLAVTDFAAWAKESHALGVEHVYLNGALKGATTELVRANTGTKIPALPRGYIEEAEPIATRRVVLAGYRTADVLNGVLGEGK